MSESPEQQHPDRPLDPRPATSDRAAATPDPGARLAGDEAPAGQDPPETAVTSPDAEDAGAPVDGAPGPDGRDSDEDSPLSRSTLASGTRWMAVGRVVTQGSRLVVSVLLARLLAPEAFGLVAVAMTAILALEVVKDLGTGAAVIQRKTVDQHMLASIFWLNVVSGVVAAGLMAGGAPLIAGAFSVPEATPVVRALSVMLLLGGLTQMHHALLRRELDFASVAAVDVAGAVTTGVISVGLALAGAGVWSMVWGNVAGAAVGTVVAWIRSSWRPTASFGIAPLRAVAGFALNTAAFNAAAFVLRNTDKLLVGRWLGSGPLGVYTLGQRTISYPMESISHVLMTVLFPAFARVQDDNEALRRGYVRAIGAICFVTFPVTVGMAAVAEPLVHALLGDAWVDLVPLLWFMAPAGALAAVLGAVNSIYSAKGRADWMFRWGVASGVLLLAGFAVGLQWGLVGLAVSYLVGYAVLTPIGLWIPLRLIDMRLGELLRPQLVYVVLTLAMAAAAWGTTVAVERTGAGPLPQLLAGVAAGAVVYGGLTLWWRPTAYRDVRSVLTERAKRG